MIGILLGALLGGGIRRSDQARPIAITWGRVERPIPAFSPPTFFLPPAGSIGAGGGFEVVSPPPPPPPPGGSTGYAGINPPPGVFPV